MPDYDDFDDDDDLELEPIDPEVLDFERQRAKDKTRQAERAVDIDEVYRDQNQPPLELDVDWIKQIRFTTRHLLIATALLAVLMTIFTKFSACNTIFVLSVIGVAAGWFWVLRNERQRNRERARLRGEMAARHAAEDAADDHIPKFESPVSPTVNTMWHSAQEKEQPAFDFSFSLKEMFGAFTFAAVLLSVLAFTSDTGTLAMLLGFVALAGLAVSALGFEPPRVVILGWWLLLVMYLAVGVAAALGMGG